LCRSRKYPYSPHRRDWNFLGGWGFCKTKKFKEMCEALVEFPEGWVALTKNPFHGEDMDIFWNYTLVKSFSKYLFSKAKITCFEETGFELTVTKILKITLQCL